MKKRFLAAFMILVMGCALTACDEEEAADGQAADTVSEAEEGSWSIYWYLCGSNLESGGGFATYDLSELMEVELPKNVNVVIETGGSSEWQNDVVDADHLQRWLYSSEGLELVDEQPSASMGERRRLYLCTVLMRNPNFLVLDEPTNDLDIVTLNVLEEYLQNFKGCVIVVSHDRYFMDKVVDHLLVFNGQGDIRDFPGNYTQYRDWKDAKVHQEKEKEKEAAKAQEDKTAKVRLNEKRRMSFKEKREFEQLEQEIADLETEKNAIEEALCSGTLSVDELTEKSKRLPELSDLIDEKTLRWLELSEIKSN